MACFVEKPSTVKGVQNEKRATAWLRARLDLREAFHSETPGGIKILLLSEEIDDVVPILFSEKFTERARQLLPNDSAKVGLPTL